MTASPQWATMTAEYGSPEHVKHMRDNYEPFAVIPLAAGVNPITRQPEISFMVFMKKQIISEIPVPEPMIEKPKGIIL